MKVLKINDTWYSAYEGAFVKSDALNEDVNSWTKVAAADLDAGVADALEKEFGSFKSGAGQKSAGISEISLEDATNVAKFDSWHITVTNSQ